MGDVVSFGDRSVTPTVPSDRVVWRCGCGCATHFARFDGQLECSSCGVVSSADCGGWRERLPSCSDDVPAIEPETVYVTDLMSSEAACWRVLSAKPSDLAAAIVMCRDGRVRAWGAGFFTADEIEWLDARFADARGLLVRLEGKANDTEARS